MTHPLETYLREMRDIRSSGAGVKETSYYTPFANLFNELGKELKPRVRCILQLANRGAGNPDGGLFTAHQFQKPPDSDPIPGQPPERGVIEVKATSDDAWVAASGPQVTKYWGKYGLVLVTNYRDFVLVGKDPTGNPVKLETYRLASDEAEFWALAGHPKRAITAHGTRFVEYLKRVMLHAASLSTPEDVAWFLSSYARDAKARIEDVSLPALAAVREALEEALGLKFEGKKGEHFFRSTLIQTLFYGIFSAWVLWSKQHSPSDKTAMFDWRSAAWHLHVPMIRTLFEQVAAPTKLQPLGLVEPLDWAEGVLNRVDRTAFFQIFDQGQAVQYFYEPFLRQFDPELRKELGVWYTPPEIVKYMVARVDTVLRRELDIEDGLADPRVYVLDPCCGTGTYLVEVLKRVAETLKQKGGDALIAQDLKKAAMERVFGFEILPAPFVVAHLQLGMLLHQLGVPLSHSSAERVAVYLTNSLTGWEPPKGPKQHLMFPELEEERDAAEDIKRQKPILVILGNPPYNAFAGVSPSEERGLVEPYKEGLNKPVSAGGWGIKKFNLDDLYVRFFRLAERRIAEMTGRGVVSYISNHSWISDQSFVILRKHLLDSFDRFWIENLHGNRKISEYGPDGRTSETIFAVAGFSPGIQQGVATSLWVKNGKSHKGPKVLFRDDVDASKAADRRKQLLDSLKAKNLDAQYKAANPAKENRYSFRPSKVDPHYMKWPRVVDLCAIPPVNGLMEKRGEALIDIDRDALERRIRMYYDSSVDWEKLRALGTGLTKDAGRFQARKARSKVLAAEAFQQSRLRRYALRPFDHRWCYYSPIRPLWNEPRPTLWSQCWDGNAFLLSRVQAAKDPEGPPFYFTSLLSDDHLLAPDASCLPLRLKPTTAGSKGSNEQLSILQPSGPKRVANLSKAARAYLKHLGIKNADVDGAEVLWFHALAIGYSSAYLSENADGIRREWPRIPLPDTKSVLKNSAELGRQVAALLDAESGVKGVTSGAIRPELKHVGVVRRVGGGVINPTSDDLKITVGWGHAGRRGVTMPGKGKIVERDYTADELAGIKDGATALGVSYGQALTLLGSKTCDVYVNGNVFWQNIPANVWAYRIGGYQVIKKWLSYREYELLGRVLTSDEARTVTQIARRITTILLLQPALNQNYDAAKKLSYSWP